MITAIHFNYHSVIDTQGVNFLLVKNLSLMYAAFCVLYLMKCVAIALVHKTVFTDLFSPLFY